MGSDNRSLSHDSLWAFPRSSWEGLEALWQQTAPGTEQNVAQNPHVSVSLPFHALPWVHYSCWSPSWPHPAPLPSGSAQLGTDCPGGEILARPQRGHNISDTIHSLSDTSSFFVFHTEAQQFSLEKARKETIWANPVLSLAQPSFLGNQACCLLYCSCASLKLSCH